MPRTRLLPVLVLLAALLQLGGAAHAVAYGDGPHEHDGVACAWAGQGERDDDVLPPPVIGLAMPAAAPVLFAGEAAVVLAPAPAIVPQGRGPPAPDQTVTA